LLIDILIHSRIFWRRRVLTQKFWAYENLICFLVLLVFLNPILQFLNLTVFCNLTRFMTLRALYLIWFEIIYNWLFHFWKSLTICILVSILLCWVFWSWRRYLLYFCGEGSLSFDWFSFLRDLLSIWEWRDAGLYFLVIS
jgi:hypothetical protein